MLIFAGCILDIPSRRISLLCSLILDSSTPRRNEFARIHTDKQAPSECTVFSPSLSDSQSPISLTLAHSLFANIPHGYTHPHHLNFNKLLRHRYHTYNLYSVHRHHPKLNATHSLSSLVSLHTVTRSSRTASSPNFT